MTTHTVTLTGLRAVYGTGTRRVTALDGVTTGFASGTFTAVMGPSGSGKSTLLHCAAGLDRPAEGTVTIDGTRLDDLGEDELTRLRRDRIGFVFQAFNLVTTLTTAQNVELPLRLAGRRPPAGTSPPRSTPSGWLTGPGTGRVSCPVASSSASRWPGR